MLAGLSPTELEAVDIEVSWSPVVGFVICFPGELEAAKLIVVIAGFS